MFFRSLSELGRIGHNDADASEGDPAPLGLCAIELQGAISVRAEQHILSTWVDDEENVVRP